MPNKTLKRLVNAWPRMSEWARQIVFLRAMMLTAQPEPAPPRAVIKNEQTYEVGPGMRAFESTLTPIPFSLSPNRRWIETDVEPVTKPPIIIGQVNEK